MENHHFPSTYTVLQIELNYGSLNDKNMDSMDNVMPTYLFTYLLTHSIEQSPS